MFVDSSLTVAIDAVSMSATPGTGAVVRPHGQRSRYRRRCPIGQRIPIRMMTRSWNRVVTLSPYQEVKMSLKVIRVSAAAYAMLEKLSEAVMGLPIARVVEELARVEPFVFRRMIMKRMEALPASDAGDGSTGGDVGSTSQPRAESAADPDGTSTGGDVRSTSQSRAGSAADPMAHRLVAMSGPRPSRVPDPLPTPMAHRPAAISDPHPGRTPDPLLRPSRHSGERSRDPRPAHRVQRPADGRRRGRG